MENACATGCAAIHAGLTSLAARQRALVLVVGVEKMTVTPARDRRQPAEGELPQGGGRHRGWLRRHLRRIAQHYFQRYGDQSDALARIAAKNHRNGVRQSRTPSCARTSATSSAAPSPTRTRWSPPLRRTDCCLVSDGAAAVVLADSDTALGMTAGRSPFRAAQQVNDLPAHARARHRSPSKAPAAAWEQALARAGSALDDLSLVETHDCFTIAELIEYEAMGLTAPGEGARAIDEGWTETDGRLPINPSGGLKAKGHPIGATGVSMHVLAAMQLTGTAGEMQIKGAKLAGIFNMGGAAVANYVSILEPLKS